MDALNTDDMIPLTDRHWRERWAQELTRANELEKKLREAERSAADWQSIALSNGEQLAHAEVEIARLRMRDSGIDAYKHALDDSDRRAAAHFSRADKLAEYIEQNWEHEGLNAETEHVRALIEEAGVECRDCGGDGRRWYDDGSDTRCPMVRDDCETCFGVGKVIR